MKKALFFIFIILFFACDKGGGEPDEPGSSSSDNAPSAQSSSGLNSNSSSSSNSGSGEIEIGSHAVLATNQNSSKIEEMYNKWINVYYITFEADGANPSFAPDEAIGSARIKAAFDGYNDGSRTCSEAIGYGMLATSLMGDWERFNKLLAFSKAFRIKNTALMRWNIDGFTMSSGGSATDADIDILASLLIAYKKTNNQNYLNDAIAIGASIYELEVESSSKLILPAMYNDPLMTKKGIFYNISYFSLVALKTLAKFDKSHDWNAVLEANLSYMEKVQNAGDGLWPDWSDPSGNPTNPENGSSDALTASDGTKLSSYETYYKEAVRIPWRIAWYYHWYGDPRAKAMLDKGFSFLRSTGVNSNADVKNFYSYTGGKQGNTTNSVPRWISLCALGMGSSANQQWINDCNERSFNFYSTTLSSYYSSSLQLIYTMLFNGRF